LKLHPVDCDGHMRERVARLTTLSRKSETALAIRYAFSRWTALARYIDDGRVEIDNNAAERSLRAVCL